MVRTSANQSQGKESVTNMGYRKIAVKGQPLTRALAHEHATLAPMPGEREVRPTRLTFLRVLLQDGAFAGPDWHRGLCVADGQMYRLDGQHTSHLLSTIPDGETFPEGLLATVTTWEFDSLADAAPLFDVFNHPKSSRSNEDAMGVYRAQLPVEAINRKLLVAISHGIADWERSRKDGKGWNLDPRHRGLYFGVPEYATFAGWTAEFAAYRNVAFLNRSAIVAEMLATWKSDPAKATEFWTYVMRESHPDPDDSTRELADVFKSWLQKRSRPNADFRRKAARAWRHFMLGKVQTAA